jgi:hypothetical protein
MGPSDSAGGVQNDLITVAAAEGFESVAVGTIWSAENTSSSLKIKEIEYRVLSVTEETSGEYGVVAMMYAGSKFAAIDQGKNIIATQQSKPQLNVDAPDPIYISLDGVESPGEMVSLTTGEEVEGGVKDDGSGSGNTRSVDNVQETEELLESFTADFTDLVEEINNIYGVGKGGRVPDSGFTQGGTLTHVINWKLMFFADGDLFEEVVLKTDDKYHLPEVSKWTVEIPTDVRLLLWRVYYQLATGSWIFRGNRVLKMDVSGLGGDP